MKPIDTHAHLQFEKFDSDRSSVIKRNSNQLLAVINPGVDLDSSEKSLALAEKIPNFYAAVGIHPHQADNWDGTYLSKLDQLVQQDKVVAVGEIGLDCYQYSDYILPSLEKQKQILSMQIELAQEYKKPILFHCREAYDELYKVISKFKPLKGLIHCFMGDTKTAEKFVNLGLLISFAGNLTYKDNTHMRKAAKELPKEFLVVETDSPYLSPEPLRGQRNEPLNVKLVIEEIAKEKNLPTDEVADFTGKNAKKLFGL